MKKADILMIALIAIVSVTISFFVARAIFGDVYNGKATVKTIEKISSDISEPRSDIFNESAINPAVEVQIKGAGASDNTAGA